MEPILYLFYTSNIALGICAAFIAYGITLAIGVIAKWEKPNNALIFPIAVCVYFGVLFSPLPSPLERQVVKLLDLQEANQVESNGTINSVIIPCIDDNFKGVRGMHFQNIIEAFQRDLDNQLKEVGSYEGKSTQNMPKTDDLCEAAWYYNDLKSKRLKLNKS